MKSISSLSFMIIFGCIFNAKATSFFVPSFEEKISRSEIIVRGTTGKSDAKWVVDEDGGEKVFTFTAFQVSEVFKGNLSSESRIQIRTYGGKIGDLGMEVPGAARFQSGDDVVLTLGSVLKDGSYPILGMASGRFQVTQDVRGHSVISGFGLNQGTKAKIAHAEEHGNDSHSHGHSDTNQSNKWTLSRLRDEIRRQAANPKAPSASNQTISKNTIKPSSNAPLAPQLQLNANEDESSDSMDQDETSESSHLKTILITLSLLIGGFLIWRAIRGRSSH